VSLTVSTLISADGVRSDPMTWVGDLFDADAVRESLARLREADAFLMGRGSYDYFQPAWARGGNPYLDAITAMPKYVFSATLGGTDWANTTVVSTDAVEAVRAMRGRRLVMYGFGRLARSLLAAGLVDELEFGVQPVVLEPRQPLRLAGVDRRTTGVVTLRYNGA
jgi:dihydrofolate reductase